MKKIISLFLISVLAVGGTVNAQKSIDNVISVDLQNNVMPIKNGDKIKGYAIFYKADKIKRGDYSYRLEILNENAEKVADKRITASKEFLLLEANYNEKLLCFKFMDYKEKKIYLKFFDENAEQVANKTYEINKYEKRAILMKVNQGMDMNPSLFALGNKGFLDYRVIDNKKQGYSVKYYPNDKSEKSWSYSSKEKSPVIEGVSMLEANENIVLNMVVHKKNLLSSDTEYWLMGLDPSTGKQKFNVRVENSKKEVGFIYFHNFVQAADGSVTGIGESFKKTVSAAGSAGKILAMASGSTGSGSAFQVTVEDFYFFEFDKDFNLKGVEIFEKDKTRIGMPAGGAYYGPQMMALLTKMLGGFDFSYLKTMDEGNTFMVFYQDYERRKGEKNNTVVGVISNTNGSFAQDKVDINTEADFVLALPAQASNVLFLEYFKKEKELEMNFQKMNF